MFNLMNRLARFSAILGGLVLVLLVVLTCISVLGRAINTFGHSDFLTTLAPVFAKAVIDTGVGPVTGDFELVEAGIAFAIFSFLPICQLYSGHATVDIFEPMMSPLANRVIAAFWEVALTAAILLITWRLSEGMLAKRSYGETTFLLQFPIWWAYGLSLSAAAVASVVGLYCAVARIVEMLTGRTILPLGQGAMH